MFCTRCGSPVTPDDHACPTCGGNLLLPGSVGFDDETPTMNGGSLRAAGGTAAAWRADAEGPGSTRIMPAVDGHDDPDATRINPRVPAQETPRAPQPATSNLPDDWFRSGTPSSPPPSPASWTRAPQPPMVEPAPGQPPVPTQRRYHERMSGAVVVALALIPVVAIAVLVWQLLQWGGVHFVGPAARTTAAARGSAIPSGATAPSGAASAPAQPSASGTASSAASSPSPSASVPAGATQCSGTVYAGPGTSCPFAEAVSAKLPTHPGGTFDVTAKSPVTRKDYRMTCTDGTLVECRGGDNAVVYVVTG